MTRITRAWRPVAGFAEETQMDANSGEFRHRTAAWRGWRAGLPPALPQPESGFDVARQAGRQLRTIALITAAGYAMAMCAAPPPDRAQIAARLEASGAAWQAEIDSR